MCVYRIQYYTQRAPCCIVCMNFDFPHNKRLIGYFEMDLRLEHFCFLFCCFYVRISCVFHQKCY